MGAKGSNAIADEKRIEVFELYKQGHSYREIAAITSMSKTRVGVYIKDQLDALAEEHKKLGREIVQAELERLDAMLKAVLPNATKGDPVAIDKVLAIMKQRDRYLRLAPPEQHEFSVTSLEDLILGATKKDE